ncbi:Protein priA [Vanrija pseudolonga]|uniref:Protein priA n=1 Tax=Vanrija pseudolonga TaxID=143232 RepID=A0AAF0YDD0_9TREE|nr:Protein priA [Vanrija pseudolonga]
MLGLVPALAALAGAASVAAQANPNALSCLSQTWWDNYPDANNVRPNLFPNPSYPDSSAGCEALCGDTNTERRGFAFYKPGFCSCSNLFSDGQFYNEATDTVENYLTDPVDAYGTCDANSMTVFWLNDPPEWYPFDKRFAPFTVCMNEPLPSESIFYYKGNFPDYCYFPCKERGGNSMAMRLVNFDPGYGMPQNSTTDWNVVMECQCFVTPPGSPPPAANGNCKYDSYLWYNSDIAVSPSTVAMRRRRSKAMPQERLHRPHTESEYHLALCPHPRRACTVPDTNAYECVDTAEELESCGGCVHGEYGVMANVTMFGQDCTAIPGVAEVACVLGNCDVRSCQRGLTLKNGACVRN